MVHVKCVIFDTLGNHLLTDVIITTTITTSTIITITTTTIITYFITGKENLVNMGRKKVFLIFRLEREPYQTEETESFFSAGRLNEICIKSGIISQIVMLLVELVFLRACLLSDTK